MTTHRICIGNIVRNLPIREVAPNVRVALFNMLGDWELTEAAGEELAKKIPEGTDILFMPDGKAQALLHVMGRYSKLPTIVARKEHKAYMAKPVVSSNVESITTRHKQELFLGADDAARLAGKNIVVIDDVVSTGGTLIAVYDLLHQVGANIQAVMSIFTEGAPRSDVISLGHLSLF